MRYDKHNGDIPDYPFLNQDWSPTSEIIPGVKDVIDWSLISPRLGMAYQIGDRQVLRAFYGKFFDADVTGNWYAPPPNPPEYVYEYGPSLDGPWTYSSSFEYHGNLFHPDLKAPETDQFTLGWERRLGDNYTFGIQGVYKEAKNLIGWEILDDGVYENVPVDESVLGRDGAVVQHHRAANDPQGQRAGPGLQGAGKELQPAVRGRGPLVQQALQRWLELPIVVHMVRLDRFHSAAPAAIPG